MREYESRNLHGWDKFLYNLYMILTFPVRRWWIILSVLATILLVLIIIPTLEGVKKEDIVDWYKAKWVYSDVNKAKNKTIAKISRKIKNLKDNVKEILPDNASDAESSADNQNGKKPNKWNVIEIRKAKYIPSEKTAVKSDAKVQDSNTFALIKEQMKENKEKEPENNPVVVTYNNVATDDFSSYYEVRSDLDLEYLDEPEIIVGTATVSGANDLYIEDTFVYLYGIYTNPRLYDINEAKEFLNDVTYGQKVECAVVAYSSQTHAKTALCFVNGVMINRQMVVEGLADNVALKME